MDDIQSALRSVKRSVTRPTLNLIFLLDTSGSMRGDGKITSLNNTMRELPLVLEKEAENKKLRLIMRAISFGSEAQFVFGSKEKGEAINSESYVWNDVGCGGKTATASAVSLAAQCLEQEFLGKKNNAPIIILITDGECTEPDQSYFEAIELINKKLSGKTIRVAVGIGNDYNTDELKKFATFGLKPTANGEMLNDYYIYSVSQNEDMAKIITDISSLMVLKSGTYGIGI